MSHSRKGFLFLPLQTAGERLTKFYLLTGVAKGHLHPALSPSYILIHATLFLSSWLQHTHFICRHCIHVSMLKQRDEKESKRVSWGQLSGQSAWRTSMRAGVQIPRTYVKLGVLALSCFKQGGSKGLDCLLNSRWSLWHITACACSSCKWTHTNFNRNKGKKNY